MLAVALRIIPQLPDAAAELVADRQRVEILEGDRILRLDPLLHVRRIEVLHPAIRIGDVRPEVVVHDVPFVRLRVGQLLFQIFYRVYTSPP